MDPGDAEILISFPSIGVRIYLTFPPSEGQFLKIIPPPVTR